MYAACFCIPISRHHCCCCCCAHSTPWWIAINMWAVLMSRRHQGIPAKGLASYAPEMTFASQLNNKRLNVMAQRSRIRYDCFVNGKSLMFLWRVFMGLIWHGEASIFNEVRGLLVELVRGNALSSICSRGIPQRGNWNWEIGANIQAHAVTWPNIRTGVGLIRYI